jgi:hypothetical protein
MKMASSVLGELSVRISQMISRRCLIVGNRHQRRFRPIGGGSIFDNTTDIEGFRFTAGERERL